MNKRPDPDTFGHRPLRFGRACPGVQADGGRLGAPGRVDGGGSGAAAATFRSEGACLGGHPSSEVTPQGGSAERVTKGRGASACCACADPAATLCGFVPASVDAGGPVPTAHLPASGSRVGLRCVSVCCTSIYSVCGWHGKRCVRRGVDAVCGASDACARVPRAQSGVYSVVCV